MGDVEKSMKDFNFQLQMFHGGDKDSVTNFQEDYKLLKERQGECRQLYFIMEEQVNQFRTMGVIGGAYNNDEFD